MNTALIASVATPGGAQVLGNGMLEPALSAAA